MDEKIKGKKDITYRIFESVEKFVLFVLDKIHLKFFSNLYREHLEGMRYLVCGALATVVNLAVKYALLFTILEASNSAQLQSAVIISWVVACIFAYITNRSIVFQSKSKKIIKEFISFCSARVVTLGLEMLIMFIFVTTLKLNTELWVVVWSIVAQIVVIIANYVFSKLFIFKKEKIEKE